MIIVLIDYLFNSLGELTRIVIFYVKEITPTR